MKDVIIEGNCIRGTQNLPVLFFTTACEFTIISKKKLKKKKCVLCHNYNKVFFHNHKLITLGAYDDDDLRWSKTLPYITEFYRISILTIESLWMHSMKESQDLTVLTELK